ncbi:MAG: tetratricopeptide repeat protein [bacterium]|nr:tetratricopeptide repeat protein [bacterium]
MKQFIVLNILVLILVQFLSGFNQEQNDTVEKANDLFLKALEYADKNDRLNSSACLRKAMELDPTKRSYIEVFKRIGFGQFAEALKLLEEKKENSPRKKELKIIQIISANVHFRWAIELERNDYLNAIKHFKASFDINIIHRPKLSLIDLDKIGSLYLIPGQNQKAMEYFKKALPICRRLKDRKSEIYILNNIGNAYYSMGQMHKALDNFDKALPICRKEGDQFGEAKTLNNIGHVYNLLGQKQKALENYEKALRFFRHKRDRRGESSILGNIGVVFASLSQKQKALEYYKKGLDICRQIGERKGEATILNNIGVLYNSFSQNREALKYLEQALPIHRQENNPSGEAASLSGIGVAYSGLDRNKQALEYLEQALSIHRQLKNKRGKAATLLNFGTVYTAMGKNRKALEYFEKALPILRTVRDLQGEATILNNFGMIYEGFSQTQKALESYEKALTIFHQMGDRFNEAKTIHNIGSLYITLGHKQKALEYLKKALPMLRQVKDRRSEAAILINIGFIYSGLAQKQKALEHYEKVLQISRDVGDHSKEAQALNNIGAIYYALGQYQKALGYYGKVLTICRKQEDHAGEGVILNNIGRVYSAHGLMHKALEYYEKALHFAREQGNRTHEARSLNNIGYIYYRLGQNRKALEFCEEALIITRQVGDRTSEFKTLNNIGMAYGDHGEKQKGLAIFYGKQAVNILQYLRQNIQDLNIKTKLKYLQSEEDTYRVTASQLISAGRLGEAQQVLEILKDDEYSAFVRKDRSVYATRYSPIDYTEFERKWINRQNTLVEKISSISVPYHELLIKKTKSPGEVKKLAAFKHNLDKAQKEYRDFNVRMKKKFEKYENKKHPDIDTLKKQADPLKKYLKSLDRANNGKNVFLKFLIYKGRISVIITTPTSQTVKQSSSFDDKEFNTAIYNYRDLNEKSARLLRFTNPSSKETTALAELFRQQRNIENKLYRLIFQPVDQYLKQYGAVNLLVSLDGVLRYIPLASLWDGKYYLVQKYRFVLFTGSDLKQINAKPVIKNKILGMGASKGGKEFKPLPFVRKEIHAIVNEREKGFKGLIKGNALIDSDFTRETMINSLKTSSYPLVHIASHFKFSPGNETDNQLLMGDGTTITLSDIRKEGKLFNNVKLLVLSACQTGMGGNGEEVDGFGRLAQQCGAKSVIASLWAVDDESTEKLMTEFYRILEKEKVTNKIEALRLAQLHLAGLEDMINKSKAAAAATSGKKTIYSQPYYWAPFIMMGNWR